ncbi:hypothetical protein PT974_04086 [Cladobotryum mycophilum]|uniref:Uncharacterized protein n=1 Tax=Cladobotryum mycophilum TaxID=491253 RepID=A0ABR0SU54_9HYPO
MKYHLNATSDSANAGSQLPSTPQNDPFKVLKQTTKADDLCFTPSQYQDDIEMENTLQKPKGLSGSSSLLRFVQDRDRMATLLPKRTLHNVFYRRHLPPEALMDTEFMRKRKAIDAEENNGEEEEDEQPIMTTTTRRDGNLMDWEKTCRKSPKALGKARAKRPRRPDMHQDVKMCIYRQPDHSESSLEVMDWTFDWFETI